MPFVTWLSFIAKSFWWSGNGKWCVMTDALKQPEIFLADKQVRHAFEKLSAGARLPKDAGRILKRRRDLVAKRQSLLLLVSFLGEVDDAFIEMVRSLKQRPPSFLLFSRDLPSQAIAERLAKLHVRNPERIHVARAQSEKSVQEILRRLLLTLWEKDEPECILDAWLEGDTFVVLSPRFKRLHVPVSKLKPLKGKSRKDLEKFEIDEDGAYIYWPTLDVHLGWEQFAQALDTEAHLKTSQQSAEFNKRYGEAIHKLRRQKELRQSDIAGLSARQVGRVERGQCRATHATLNKLAKSHGMSTTDYMAGIAATLA